MKIHTISIDLGKTSFHLVGLNERGEVAVGKRFSRAQLLRFTANRKIHLIGMEACGAPIFLAQLKVEIEQLDTRVGEADAVIEQTACENEACQRLVKVPGIGPVTATAVIAAIGNGAAFRKGREFAAWMGVVPREHSTGGKQKLLGISKRGNRYLRKLFVQCARAVLQQKTKQSPDLKAWLEKLTSRTHRNVAGVALANKLARMAWAVMATGEAYRAPLMAAA